jgi:hypothetical protein
MYAREDMKIHRQIRRHIGRTQGWIRASTRGKNTKGLVRERERERERKTRVNAAGETSAATGLQAQ